MPLLLVPAAVVRRQTLVVPLSPQAHLEIHNLQVRVHRKVLLVLVGLAKGVEGGHIVGAIVRGGGRHLAMDAKVLVNLCDEFPQELVRLPFLKTIIIDLVYKLNLYLIGTYSF